GTFQYMAPEQLEGKEADARSDIFSFGAVLFEMATGKRAFEGKSQASVIAAILEREPPAISSLQPMSPPELDRVVRICLSKDPDDRFQTAHDLRLQLEWIRDSGSQAGVPAPVVAHRKHRERLWIAATAFTTIIAALFAVGYYFWAPRPAPAIVARVLPPEGVDFVLSGNRAGPPVLSPDGQRLAFVGLDKDGKQLLWVQSLNSTAPQQLMGTEGASFPFWSPDSQELGFFANDKLNRIDAAGGPVLALCDVSNPRGGTWNDYGTILFTPGTGDPIYSVPATGGTPQPVTKLNRLHTDSSHRWPQFLPDGKHFLFFALSSDLQNGGIYVADLGGGEPKQLIRNDSSAAYGPPGYLLFVRQGALMAQRFDSNKLAMAGEASPLAESVGVSLNIYQGIFSASGNGLLAYAGGNTLSGDMQMLWFDRSGKQVAQTGTPGIYFNPAISPDGRKLAVAIQPSGSTGQDIWVFDLVRGVKTRLTFTPGLNREPTWSLDGKFVTFISNYAGGHYHVYTEAADGTGGAKPVVVDDQDEFLASFSKDGRYLVMQRTGTGTTSRAGIWALPAFGDRKLFPVAQGEFDYIRPSLSPDGKWLAYQSTEAGHPEIFALPFPRGNGKWLVSSNGGFWPRWSPDGKELFYISPDLKLMGAEVTDRGTSLDIGKVQELFQTYPAFTATSFYDVAPDGKRFIIISRKAAQSVEPLTLVVNWPALLKKQQ
ncbi:MAG TPA: protein kinase, partial [Candidatus Acidoferrales bacterium]|nr:protein kinase [Candidatus Acidoferrales bacterium]HEV2341041.1 protein kinase [Candidatus Acidoferrales bacterium]